MDYLSGTNLESTQVHFCSTMKLMKWGQRNKAEGKRKERDVRLEKWKHTEIKERRDKGRMFLPLSRYLFAWSCSAAFCSSAASLHGDLLLCFDANESQSLVFKWLSPSLHAAAAERSLPAVSSNSQLQVADLLPKHHRMDKLCVCCVCLGGGKYSHPPPTQSKGKELKAETAGVWFKLPLQTLWWIHQIIQELKSQSWM